MTSKNKSFLRAGCSAIALQLTLLAVTPAPAEAVRREKVHKDSGLSEEAAKAAAARHTLTPEEIHQLRSDPAVLTARLQEEGIQLNPAQIVALGQSLRAMGIHPGNREESKDAILAGANLVQNGAVAEKLTRPTLEYVSKVANIDDAIGNAIIGLINTGAPVTDETVSAEVQLRADNLAAANKAEQDAASLKAAKFLGHAVQLTGLTEAQVRTLIGKLGDINISTQYDKDGVPSLETTNHLRAGTKILEAGKDITPDSLGVEEARLAKEELGSSGESNPGSDTEEEEAEEQLRLEAEAKTQAANAEKERLRLEAAAKAQAQAQADAEKERLRLEAEAKAAENARVAEAAENARVAEAAENARVAEAAENARVAEAAEKARIAEEEKLKTEAAEKARIAEATQPEQSEGEQSEEESEAAESEQSDGEKLLQEGDLGSSEEEEGLNALSLKLELATLETKTAQEALDDARKAAAIRLKLADAEAKITAFKKAEQKAKQSHNDIKDAAKKAKAKTALTKAQSDVTAAEQTLKDLQKTLATEIQNEQTALDTAVAAEVAARQALKTAKEAEASSKEE